MKQVKKFRKSVVSMPTDYKETYNICVNPEDGESVIIEIDVFDNGDDKNNLFYNTSIKAMGYGTHESMIKFYKFSPQQLLKALTAIVKKLPGVK